MYFARTAFTFLESLRINGFCSVGSAIAIPLSCSKHNNGVEAFENIVSEERELLFGLGRV